LATPAGSLPLLRWARGPLSVPCKLGTPTYKLQVKTRSGSCIHAPPPNSTRPYLPAKVGSYVVTCPVAPDPTSLLGRALAFPRVSWLRTLPSRRALVPPCVPRHQTPPPCSGGLRRCHVSRSSLWAANLKNKESLPGIPMRLDSSVSKACPHVTEMPDT
jgi:hypothetical protein